MKVLLLTLSLTVFVYDCLALGKGQRLLTKLDSKKGRAKGEIPNAVVSATSNSHGLTGGFTNSLLNQGMHNETTKIVSMLSTMNINEAKALEKSLNKHLGPKKPSLAKGTITRNIIHQLDWIKKKLRQVRSESVKKTDVYGRGAESKKQKIIEQIFAKKNEILKEVKRLEGEEIDKNDAQLLEFKVKKMEKSAGDDETSKESLENLREAFKLLIKKKPNKHFNQKVKTEPAKTRAIIGVPDRRFFAGRLGPGPVDDVANSASWTPTLTEEVFTQWSPWSKCSHHCGKKSRRSRSRFCKVPSYTSPFVECPGWQHQVENCATRACPVNGGFTKWSEWSDCSNACGESSVRMRVRECTNPAPANGGKDCHGWRTQVKRCDVPACEDLNTQQDSTTNE